MNTLNIVESIFLAALEKETPEARAAYLAEACQGDANLRRCVERLLNAHARADSILPEQAPGLPATVEPCAIEERPGSIIGPYKLLQKLGEGGFGVVFLAEQEQPVRRKVALKIIKPGMDSKQIIARFEAERQALALMDHPNIARVLDAGTTESGRPYFVMELVKGVPITEFSDQNRLTPRERLKLFIPVCQAVQHAHQKGIIHRDLKPTNVLVTLYDDKPVPKVIDFGVAKAIEQKLTEQTLFTRVGQVVGTLEYMSPEQASLNALDVDTRSDVYALGVLLYELLTGSTPLKKEQLEGVAFMEMLRLIREAEPPRPSTRLSEMKGSLPLMASYRKTDAQKLPKLVAGELDWIAMKALDKDRSRRYETASALAADVQRYLKDEPVEARAPSRWYRLRKMARRNQGAVLAGTLVAAALLVGTVVAWTFALEAGRNAAWALDEKDKADRQTEVAEAREKEAKEANAQLRVAQEDQLRFLYPANMKLVQTAWQADNASRVLDLLEAVAPAPGQKDLRHFEWHYWNRLINGAKQVVPLKNGEPRVGAAFSPDQSLLASIAVDGDQVVVRLWDIKTGAVVRNLKGPVLAQPPTGQIRGPNPAIGQIAFSADGQWLAATIRTRTVAANGKGPGGFAKGPEGFPLELSAPELWLWETTNEKAQWQKALPGSLLGVIDGVFQFHPDGDRIAVEFRATKSIDILARKNRAVLDTIVAPEEAKKVGFSNRLLCLSPDWKKLLVTQYPKNNNLVEVESDLLLLWDVQKNKEVWRANIPVGSNESVFDKFIGMARLVAAFSPDGKRLAVPMHSIPDQSSRIEIWDAGTGKTLCQCEEDSPASASAKAALRLSLYQFSPDGKALLAKSRFGGQVNGQVCVWDATTGKLQQKVLIPTESVWDVTFNTGGDKLYIAAGKTVQIWPASKPGPFLVHAGPKLNFYWPSLSGDGRRLATKSLPLPKEIDPEADQNGMLQVFDTTDSKELLTIKNLRARVLRYVLSADGKRLIACLGAHDEATADKQKSEIVVWDVDERKEIASCPLPTALDVGGKARQAFPVRAAFSVDGRLAAVSWPRTENEQVLKVWKLPDGRDGLGCKEIFTGTFAGAHLGLLGAQFSRDGRFVFFATAKPAKAKEDIGKTVAHILDLKTGKELPSIPAGLPISNFSFKPKGPILTDISFSPDGNLLAWYDGPAFFRSTANSSYDIVVADLHSKNKKNLRLMGHTATVRSMAFSPDGQRLASLAFRSSGIFSSREIKIWDLHTGQDVLTLTGEGTAGTLQFSADGRRLFIARQFLGSTKAGKSFPSRCEVHTWDATPLSDAGP
jgi:serine/threonine protein kinase/WD40 repeat protein